MQLHLRQDGVPSSPSRQRGLAKSRDIFAQNLCPTLHPVVDGVPGGRWVGVKIIKFLN
jgi:hypothetical protein